MLNRFDDYPIHQTSDPVAHMASGDRNAYDRYWFNGYSRTGDLYFGGALGLYPNRSVMDAAFSFIVDGQQHVVRASRLAPKERTDTVVGPISVEVTEPMREIRFRVQPNDQGIEVDLVFRARTLPVEEPRMTLRSGVRVIMDTSRFTQFGTWEGEIRAGGSRYELSREDILATRDRSWGVRPVGEPDGGAPGMLPQFFWLWAPIHFDDSCTLFQTAEESDGRVWHSGGRIVPAGGPGQSPQEDWTLREAHMKSLGHKVQWQPGTRRAQSARLSMTTQGGEAHEIELEPVLTHAMRGLGYTDPDYGHGQYKGDLAISGDCWNVDEMDPMDFRHLHVQQVCKARMGDREGMGVLEQMVIGEHAPSGFKDFLDPAS